MNHEIFIRNEYNKIVGTLRSAIYHESGNLIVRVLNGSAILVIVVSKSKIGFITRLNTSSGFTKFKNYKAVEDAIIT